MIVFEAFSRPTGVVQQQNQIMASSTSVDESGCCCYRPNCSHEASGLLRLVFKEICSGGVAHAVLLTPLWGLPLPLPPPLLLLLLLFVADMYCCRPGRCPSPGISIHFSMADEQRRAHC